MRLPLESYTLDEDSSSEVQPQIQQDTFPQENLGALRRFLATSGGEITSLLVRKFSRVLTKEELDEALFQGLSTALRAETNFDSQLGEPRAWVWAITSNAAKQILRNRSKHLKLLFDSDALDVPHPVPAEASKAQRRLMLDLVECIQALPRLQRATLLADMHAGGCCCAKDIATRLRSTVGSVYVARSNGRKALAAALESRGHRLGPPRTCPRETK